MRRARFQRGWLDRQSRKSGDVWIYRFREYGPDGTCIQRSVTLGPVKKYPKESDALRAVELKRLDINSDVSEQTPGLMTIAQLAKHYRREELTDATDPEEGKASSTKDSYESYIVNHIVPEWGSYHLGEVKTIAIEKWLRGLTKKPRPAKEGQAPEAPNPMARGTKAKIRNIMHAMYEHAIRYEFCDRNPVAQVRQSAKRERLPEILDVSEFAALLDALNQRERAMVMTDAGSGLRRGELFALQWDDIDWLGKQADVRRSIVHNTKRDRIGICKTETSRKPVPLDDFMLEELGLWRQQTAYRAGTDWVFASPAADGKMPYWPQTIMKRFVHPAAKRVGIKKHIGWHTFRHTYSTLLKANGEDPKVVQELLRHANFHITMDGYTQALSPAKREAQSKVVQMLVRKAGA